MCIRDSSRYLLFGLALLVAPELPHAQGVDQALTEARARLICGTGTAISAQQLPGGLLEVICRKNVPRDSLPKEMKNTGLNVATEVVMVATATIFVIVVGSSSSSTTTTD